jgi:hypothetical protein
LGQKEAGYASTSIPTILGAVKYSRDDNAFPRPIDLIYKDIGKSRHHPFECIGIATDMAHERKRDQRFSVAEQSVDHSLRSGRAVPGNLIEDMIEIGERLIVEDELHIARYEPIRAMRSRASA